MAYPPRKRPIGVVLLAVLVILGGVLLTIVALLATLRASVIFAAGGGAILLILMLIFLILSLILLSAGFGLYNLRPWAWWLAVFVLVLVLLSNIASFGLAFVSLGAILVPVIIPAFILIYLLAVRSYFRSPPPHAYPYPPPPR